MIFGVPATDVFTIGIKKYASDTTATIIFGVCMARSVVKKETTEWQHRNKGPR